MLQLQPKIDFRQYTQAIRISAPYVKPLALELGLSAPDDSDEHEKAAMSRVEATADAILDTLSERDRDAPTPMRKPLRIFRNAWTAAFETLGGKARVESEKGERAAALQATLFPDALAFANAKAPAAWSEGFRRIRRMQAENLRAQLEELVGADVVTELEQSTENLGRALHFHEPRETPSSTALSEQLLRFSRAVAFYCRVLSGSADDEDPESMERFRLAVAPIDAYRSRRGGDDELVDEEVTAPDTAEPQTEMEAPASDA